MKRIMCALLVSLMSFTMLTGFGLGDLKKEIKPKTEKCEGRKDEASCKRKEKLKAAGKVVAIGIAAKLITDMVIDFKSKKSETDASVKSKYLQMNKALPAKPQVLSYTSSISPDGITSGGKKVLVSTSISVVPGKNSNKAKIEERIEIYDNDDNSKMIKSLSKEINNPELIVGTYENQFSFSLPTEMPQGVYPIKTTIMLDGKEQPSQSQKMQVVLHVFEDSTFQIAAIQ